MQHTMKIWERIIERRLREETSLGEEQFGFMPGRGTTDAVFALRQLMEKHREKRKVCIWYLLIWKKRMTEYRDKKCGDACEKKEPRRSTLKSCRICTSEQKLRFEVVLGKRSK